ncbi:hypothetical protein [Thalassobacillus sp. C254]|nr:hypothetical protein [Thalassobacillus sp. C254]
MREKELDGDLYDEKYEDPSPEDFLTDEEERKKEYNPKKKKGNKPL